MFVGCVRVQKRWVGFDVSTCSSESPRQANEERYEICGYGEQVPVGRVLSRDRWLNRLRDDGFSVQPLKTPIATG